MDTRTDSSRGLIGQTKSALDTPALLVDLDVMEANIARIAATCRAHSGNCRRGTPMPPIINIGRKIACQSA